MLLICWCCDALMLLMRWCSDALMLLMRWSYWCTNAADALMLLMHWCSEIFPLLFPDSATPPSCPQVHLCICCGLLWTRSKLVALSLSLHSANWMGSTLSEWDLAEIQKTTSKFLWLFRMCSDGWCLPAYPISWRPCSQPLHPSTNPHHIIFAKKPQLVLGLRARSQSLKVQNHL